MINWQYVAKAIKYYQDLGYYYIEVPWTVSKEAMAITSPLDSELYNVDNKYLVASAEQSFIELMLNGEIDPEGKFIAASPCFRDDPLDELHKRYFFKVELINILAPDQLKDIDDLVWDMVVTAKGFYYTEINATFKPLIVNTEIGFDLTGNGIELGSYGYRSFRNFHWIYGTGFAEPRFSYVNGIKQ